MAPDAGLPAAPPAGRVRRLPAVLLGIALGGFFDGILLHQILQWHHLLSLVPGAVDLRTQILWDGLFHGLMYLIAIAALWLLWRDTRRDRALPPRHMAAALLIGFGLWHILDGLLSHWLLGIHRIRPEAASPLFWDIAFFAGLGLLPLAAGLGLQRHEAPPPSQRPGRTLAALGLLALTSGLWALRPPPDQPFTTVVFRPGLPADQIQARLDSLGARIIWAEPQLEVAILALPPARRRELYRQGALLVGGGAAPAICFTWLTSSL